MTESDPVPTRPRSRPHRSRPHRERGVPWVSNALLGLALVLALVALPACGAAGANEDDEDPPPEQTDDEIPAPPGRP